MPVPAPLPNNVFGRCLKNPVIPRRSCEPLAVFLLVILSCLASPILAQVQSCAIENGDFSQGSTGWTLIHDSPGGQFYGVFPDSGLDGELRVQLLGEAVTQGSSGTLTPTISCGTLPGDHYWLMSFRTRCSAGGEGGPSARLSVQADGRTLFAIGRDFGWSAMTAQVALPEEFQSLSFGVSMSSCFECEMSLYMDDIRILAIPVPVLPTTWSAIKTRWHQ
jgi:hypothetical protein